MQLDHTRKLVETGKYLHSRAFKSVKSLPMIYKAHRAAWRTQSIFHKWFDNNFMPEVTTNFSKLGLPEDSKVVLLSKNNTSSPKPEDLVSIFSLLPRIQSHLCSL